MVTTIGIDPHKATHTAVAIDDDETVLAEITIRADKDQATKLLDWAGSVNGDGRVWAVEAATGLGHLLSQQLVAPGETVVDVPPVLAHGSGCCSRGSRTRTTRTMPAPSLLLRCVATVSPKYVVRTTQRSCGCWRSGTANSPRYAPRRCVASMRCSPCCSPGGMGHRLSAKQASRHARRAPWPRHGR